MKAGIYFIYWSGIIFTLVLHKNPGPKARMHINLDEATFQELTNDQHRSASHQCASAGIMKGIKDISQR